MKIEPGEPCKVKWWGSKWGHKASRVREVRSWSRNCLIGKKSLRAGSEVGEERAWERRPGKGRNQGRRVRTGKRAVSRRGHYRRGADAGARGPAVVAVLEAQAAGWA